jgi:hypothetical protein
MKTPCAVQYAFRCTFKNRGGTPSDEVTKDDCKRCEQRKILTNKTQPLRKFPRICEYCIKVAWEVRSYSHDPPCARCGKPSELFLVSDEEWEHYIQPDERDSIICSECYAASKALVDSEANR